METNKSIEKIIATVNRKFAFYPNTQEVLDLKEELISIMIDKYHDLPEKMTEKQKIKSCLEVMGSYKDVLYDLESITVKKIMKVKMIDFSLFASIYVFLTVVLYLVYSLVIAKTFEKTYFIVVASAIIFVFISAILLYYYFKHLMFEKMQRASLSFIYTGAIAFIYVIPNLYLTLYKNINVWHPTWIVIILIGLVYSLHDTFKYQKHMHKAIRIMRRVINTLLLATVLYLGISFCYGHGYLTWLIYVVWLFASEIEVFATYKYYQYKKLKINNKN